MANENGFSYTGLVRGVSVKEFQKKDKSGTFTKRTFVCEGSNLQRQEFSVSDEQAKLGWVEKLAALRDKVVTFPCEIRVNGEYVNFNLGDSLPVEVKPAAVKPASVA